MIILKYSANKTPDEIANIFDSVKSQTKEEVICIPQDWEILNKCPVNQLKYIRDMINEAIEKNGNNELE